MRHVLICPEYPPAPGGGIGTYASAIVELRVRSGESVHVLTVGSGRPGALVDRPERGLTVHRLPGESFSRAVDDRLGELLEAAAIDVIESQEYDAPLFDFLQRTSASDRPPVVVHLHSPTELIALHNGRESNRHDVAEMIHRETECILAADRLVSPSVWLAEWAMRRFGLDRDRIEVVPYPGPAEDFGAIERDRQTWAEGTIAYLGRLEPRKGALEWIEVAASAARRRPSLRFSFSGRNVLGPNRIQSRRKLQERLGRGVLGSFDFQGHVDRSRYLESLARARVAVVPSRWDNLPYTCLEAMASGLPVITTPHGGMAEVVEDGISGWIASECSVDALRRELERMLAVPASELEEMGRRARLRVAAVCDGATVLGRHRELRRSLLASSAGEGIVRPSVVRTAAPGAAAPALEAPSLLATGWRTLLDLPQAAVWTLRQALHRRRGH